MDIQYLNDVAVKRVGIEWARALREYPLLPTKAPGVRIRKALKTTAGLAHYDKHMVDFSASLMWEHTEHFVKDTIPHEVAHIVTRLLYPKAKGHHNREWYYVMKTVYNIDATRCHSLTNSEWEARKAKAL